MILWTGLRFLRCMPWLPFEWSPSSVRLRRCLAEPAEDKFAHRLSSSTARRAEWFAIKTSMLEDRLYTYVFRPSLPPRGADEEPFPGAAASSSRASTTASLRCCASMVCACSWTVRSRALIFWISAPAHGGGGVCAGAAPGLPVAMAGPPARVKNVSMCARKRLLLKPVILLICSGYLQGACSGSIAAVCANLRVPRCPE